MVTIDLLYKLGLNSNIDIDMNVDKEFEEFITFVKIIKDPVIMFGVCQAAVLKTYSVYQNISIYLKNLELNLDEVINDKSNYNVYSALLTKVEYLYSSASKFYVEELFAQAKSEIGDTVNSLNNTFKLLINPESLKES